MPQPPDIFLFFGRFHVLLVHLPIGMLAALAVLELAAFLPRFKNANASAGFLIALTAPLAVITALCGWFLSLTGGYDETLLAWHKWLGIVTAAGCALTAILYWRKKFNLYRTVLFVTTLVLLVAGHLGGSLTHGSDYLTRYAPKWFGAAKVNKSSASGIGKNLSELPVFAAVIEPIFGNKCVNCHGAAKSKGGLRLDSFSAVMKGGEDGAVIQAGNAGHSPLIQRALLPADSDDHMPPAGKPQLTAGEIALLKWWIDAGAPENKTVAELNPPSDIVKILSASSDQPASKN